MTPRWLFASLLALAAAAGAQAQPRRFLYDRLFPQAPFVALDPALLAKLDEAGESRVHALLVFSEPVSPEQHEKLREAAVDVRLLSFLGRNAYTVSLPGPADRLRALEGVALATLLRAEEKLEAGLAAGDHPPWAFDAGTGRLRLLVETWSEAALAGLEESLSTLGLRGARHGPRTLRLELDPAELRRLAELDLVKRIEPGPIPFLPLNSAARDRVRSNLAQQAIFVLPQPTYRVSGAGVRIGICDSGIDEKHDDFDEVDASGAAGASRVDRPRAELGFHGTHVASIAAGSGLNSLAQGEPAFDLRGHAPMALLADYDGFSSKLEASHQALVEDGTDLTNHSYVQSFQRYDLTAAGLDTIVRGDASYQGAAIPARPQTWSAGNSGKFAEFLGRGAPQEGYHSVFTSAKNTISVGSIDALTGRLSDFSSLGPTLDGRLKPDLVAPGCRDSWAWKGIRAAQIGTQSYNGDCGTSMAAPVVAGVVALMMQEHRKSSEKSANLLPSTYKAILVHTAEDQIKLAAYPDKEFNSPDTNAPVLYAAGPDFATGWGLVDAERARQIVALGHWREDEIASTGQSDEWCLQVTAGSAEIRATLAWDDEPADTLLATGQSALVNDLDLELVQPGLQGGVVLPWTVEPPPIDPTSQADLEPAQRGVDRRNNVEMATWSWPGAGTWRARVSATSLPLGKSQRYSLVGSHVIAVCK